MWALREAMCSGQSWLAECQPGVEKIGSDEKIRRKASARWFRDMTSIFLFFVWPSQNGLREYPPSLVWNKHGFSRFGFVWVCLKTGKIWYHFSSFPLLFGGQKWEIDAPCLDNTSIGVGDHPIPSDPHCIQRTIPIVYSCYIPSIPRIIPIDLPTTCAGMGALRHGLPPLVHPFLDGCKMC